MTALTISPTERRHLRALAHHLRPVVLLGHEGLTAAVEKECDAALKVHALIKVRVHGDDRSAREEIYNSLCSRLRAAPVQHIGKLLVLWRPKPEKTSIRSEADEDRMPGPKEVKVLKYSKRGGQRPEVKRFTLLGNQRLTSTGKVKRAKPRASSIKKRVAD